MVNIRDTSLLPSDNLKDMDPEEIAEVVEEAEKMTRQGMPEEDAFDRALEVAKSRKEQDRGRYGAELVGP
jgi:hypothetical protein